MKRTTRGVVAAGVVITCTGLLCAYHRSFYGSPATKQGSTTPQACRRRTPHPNDYTSVVGQKALYMHCKTCTLVTSSGQLTGSHRGKDIDSSECVIRMNDAPTYGYEQDVGRRTSLRVVAHSSVQKVLSNWRVLHDNQDAVVLVWGPDSYMRRDGKGRVYNRLRLLTKVLPNLKVFMVSQLKMKQFDELFRTETGIDRTRSNTWLSTGWFTMVIALEICDRISVYGMVPPDLCASPSHLWRPYHYYQPSGPSECAMYLGHERAQQGSRHRFLTEKRVFASWAQMFHIRFYQPEWGSLSASSHPPPGTGRPCADPALLRG